MIAEQACHRSIMKCQLELIEEPSRRTAESSGRAGLRRRGEANVTPRGHVERKVVALLVMRTGFWIKLLERMKTFTECLMHLLQSGSSRQPGRVASDNVCGCLSRD